MIKNICCSEGKESKQFQCYLDRQKNIKIFCNKQVQNIDFLQILFQIGQSQSGSKLKDIYNQKVQKFKCKFSQTPTELQILVSMETLRHTLINYCIKGNISFIKVKQLGTIKNQQLILTLYKQLMQTIVSLTKDLLNHKKKINVLINWNMQPKFKKYMHQTNLNIFNNITQTNNKQMIQTIGMIQQVLDQTTKNQINKK